MWHGACYQYRAQFTLTSAFKLTGKPPNRHTHYLTHSSMPPSLRL